MTDNDIANFPTEDSDSGLDTIAGRRRPCIICDDSPKGTYTHYDKVHGLCIIQFEPDGYEMAIPQTRKEGKRVYHCPICECNRSEWGTFRAHSTLAGGGCRGREKWLDHQLHQVQTCTVTFKGGFNMVLERDPGGSFWCEGCGLGTPFPGTIQLHALGCVLEYPPPMQLPTDAAEKVTEVDSEQPNASPVGDEDITTWDDEEEEVEGSLCQEPEDDDDQDLDETMVENPDDSSPPAEEFVQGTVRAHRISEAKSIVCANSSDRSRRVSISGREPRAPVEQDVFASTGPVPPPVYAKPRPLTSETVPSFADCEWEPCLPDKDVLAFVDALPVPKRTALKIFHVFAVTGVQSEQDLNTLTLLIHNHDQAQRLLTKYGLSFPEWLFIRHALVIRVGSDACTRQDLDLMAFLATCKPCFSHRAYLFHHMCIHTLDDLRHLFAPGVLRLLLSQGFTFPEWLSLKRALRSVSIRPKDATRAQVPVSAVNTQGIIASVGLDTEEDFDILCSLPQQEQVQVFNMLSNEGLSWKECKALQAGLKARAMAMTLRQK